jgi:hypothetical protein
VSIGSEWILGRFAVGVEWIQLAHDRGRWRALTNAVMNLRILAPRICLVIAHECPLIPCALVHETK